MLAAVSLSAVDYDVTNDLCPRSGDRDDTVTDRRQITNHA
jgi:hypothetical protein